jgi:signal transduction histidine kinase
MAHPLVPSLIGNNLSGLVLKDRHGREQPMMLVNFVKNHGAGWLSYMWPKPGAKEPSEKMCYLLKVPDTNVFLVAGFCMD